MKKINFEDKKIKYDMNYHENKFGTWIKNKKLYKIKGEYSKRNYFNFGFREEDAVLEFGCGIGQNIAWIKNAYGYEKNKELYPLLKSKGIKMFDEINDIPNNFFDKIILCMVLEHLPDPIKTINFLKKKLKQNGLLIIVLPALNYSLKKRGSLNTSIDGHLFGWTFYEINYLLNYCGFINLINKKVYRKGIDRFWKLYRYGLYFHAITFLGKILNEFDIVIISRKKIINRDK